MQGVSPANVDNHSAIGRRPDSATVEPTIFMSRYEVEATQRREKEKEQ